MQKWNLVYKDEDFGPFDYEVFQCQAENIDHAEEQCYDAYPSCEVLWADTEKNPEETVKNWLSVSMESD